MKLLLDTHALLWFAADDRRLSRRAAATMEAEAAELYISAATVWELSLKCALGRVQLPAPVDRYISQKIAEGYRLLAVDWTQPRRWSTSPDITATRSTACWRRRRSSSTCPA